MDFITRLTRCFTSRYYSGIRVTVANANHFNHVPGRKTGITYSQWIARLELNNLIAASRIIFLEMYNLRSLSRSRKLLVQIRTELKKIHHLSDGSSIRLSFVLSALFGRSGSVILTE